MPDCSCRASVSSCRPKSLIRREASGSCVTARWASLYLATAWCWATSWPSFSAADMISDVSAGMGISSVKPLTIAVVAIDRYHRQTLLPQIGHAGQAWLASASVLLVGCGALGSTIAEQLARAGV